MSGHIARAISPPSDLLWEIVKRDLRSRNRRTLLGALWVIVGPILATTVIVVSLSGIFAGQFGSVSGYAVYTLSGVIFVQFTSVALITVANSVLGARGIVTKIVTHPMLFPYAAVISSGIGWVITTTYLVLMNLVVTGALPQFSLVVVMILYAAFLLGVGLVIASIHTRYEDVGTVLPWLIQGLFFLTPVFYSIDIWPQAVREVLVLNPIYWFLTAFRGSAGVAEMTSNSLFWMAAVAAIVALAGGFVIFRRTWPALVKAL